MLLNLGARMGTVLSNLAAPLTGSQPSFQKSQFVNKRKIFIKEEIVKTQKVNQGEVVKH